MEVRAKLPSGRGMWPARWMLGTNIRSVGWPKCGEIDIMEAVGHEPGKVFANVHWFSGEKGRHAFFGGSWGGGKKGIDDRIFPQRYVIDYVRIYRKG